MTEQGKACPADLAKEAPMDIERFLNEQNIRRYRKLLDIADDEIQRRQIENLLAEEEEIARELVPTEPNLTLIDEPAPVT
jgi:hypothetical protein